MHDKIVAWLDLGFLGVDPINAGIKKKQKKET
jgi:hypothetical protein